jgi:hypothetical protein
MLGFPVNPRVEISEQMYHNIVLKRTPTEKELQEEASCHNLQSSFSLYGRSRIRQTASGYLYALALNCILYVVLLVV